MYGAITLETIDSLIDSVPTSYSIRLYSVVASWRHIDRYDSLDNEFVDMCLGARIGRVYIDDGIGSDPYLYWESILISDAPSTR